MNFLFYFFSDPKIWGNLLLVIPENFSCVLLVLYLSISFEKALSNAAKKCVLSSDQLQALLATTTTTLSSSATSSSVKRDATTSSASGSLLEDDMDDMYLAPSAAQVLAMEVNKKEEAVVKKMTAEVEVEAKAAETARAAVEASLSVEAREAAAYHRAADQFMASFRALATFIRRKQVFPPFFFFIC